MFPQMLLGASNRTLLGPFIFRGPADDVNPHEGPGYIRRQPCVLDLLHGSPLCARSPAGPAPAVAYDAEQKTKGKKKKI